MINECLKYGIHTGTCDCCDERNVRVLHFRYDRQPDSWRVCHKCMTEAFIETELYRKIKLDVVYRKQKEGEE